MIFIYTYGIAANPPNLAHEVSFPPKYVDLYEQKPKAIKSFGIRISPLLESANIKPQNIEKHFTPNIPALCLKQPKTNLANKLLDNNISTKDWWKFLKICLGKDAKENIPPLHFQNETINNPKDKADIFNAFFHSQSLLDETNKDIPTLSEPINTLDSIHLEIEEVCSILKSLKVGKACGPDMINN